MWTQAGFDVDNWRAGSNDDALKDAIVTTTGEVRGKREFVLFVRRCVQVLR